MMIWLKEYAESCELHGTDTDHRAIRWAQENLPFATFKTNSVFPPLDYPDGFFDLVINHSVFTHINAEFQDKWLAELRRVTKPGATLVLSFHGDHAFHSFEKDHKDAGTDTAGFRHQFDNGGILFIEDDSWIGSPFGSYYHTTFHASWYVREHWGKYFKIEAHLPRADLDFQDLVVLTRTEDSASGKFGGARRDGAPVRNDLNSGKATKPLPAHPAFDLAGELLGKGPDVSSASRLASLAVPARRLILRALRHYTDYQRKLDTALLEAALESMAEHAATRRSVAVLREALLRQGDRMNRLEADLFEALDQLKKQRAAGEASNR